MKPRSVTIALAIFLGAFGVHHFYLNRPALGILSLLLCWTLLPLLSALVEVLIYLSMSDNAFDERVRKA